jgi:hypothetical protein
MGLYMDVPECTSQRALFAQLDSDYSWTVMNFLILLLFESTCLSTIRVAYPSSLLILPMTSSWAAHVYI